MKRFWRCWPVFFSLGALTFISPVRGENFPVNARDFLQMLEPNPSMMALYSFFDVYHQEFSECRENATQIKALFHVSEGGDKEYARNGVKRLSTCPNLSATERADWKRLSDSLSPPDVFAPGGAPASVPVKLAEGNSPIAGSDLLKVPTPDGAKSTTEAGVVPLPGPPTVSQKEEATLPPKAARLIIPRRPPPVVRTASNTNMPCYRVLLPHLRSLFPPRVHRRPGAALLLQPLSGT